jgi:hypothetical protein
MLDFAKVLLAEAEQGGAVELGVAADIVVELNRSAVVSNPFNAHVPVRVCQFLPGSGISANDFLPDAGE